MIAFEATPLIKPPALRVVSDYAIIDYAPVTIGGSFSGVTLQPSNILGQQVSEPVSVKFPNQSSYQLYYTSYAQLYLIEKWVAAMDSNNPARRVAYTWYNLPSYNGASYPSGAVKAASSNNTAQTDCPKFSQRSEWGENWNGGAEAVFDYSFTNSGGWQTTQIMEPAALHGSSTTQRTYVTRISSDGLTHEDYVYADPTAASSGTGWLKKATTTYATDSGSNQRVASTLVEDNATLKRKTAVSYTQVNGVQLPYETTEYAADTTTVYRITRNEYVNDGNYANKNILVLPLRTQILNASGIAVAKTEYNYDEPTYFLNSTSDNVIQHDTANYGGTEPGYRGNLTSVRQYETAYTGTVPSGLTTNSRLVRKTTYDSQGNVREVRDALDRTTFLGVWDNFVNKPSNVGETHGMVTVVQDPETYKNGGQYNWYTGLPTQSYHIKQSNNTPENITSYTYDNFDRPSVTNYPNGGQQQTHYWDNWLAVAQYTLIDTGLTRYGFTAYDGSGHTRWTGGDHPDGTTGKFSLQRFVYDAVGRTTQVSNVTAINGNFVNGNYVPIDDDASGYQLTTTVYDVLDRPLTITRPDSNVVSYNYTGCGCAGSATVQMTDERGKKRKTSSDHLGRLLQAHDLVALSGATYDRAEYSYTILDQLTTIKHYDSGNDNFQTRSFVYDGYNRVTSQTVPETGTTAYTYTGADEVYTVTLGNGRLRTFEYWARGMVKNITHNAIPGSNPVAYDTPNVYYEYDEYGARKLMRETYMNESGPNNIGKTEYDYNSYHQLQTETRTLHGLAGVFKLDYQYTKAGMLKTMTYTIGATGGWVRNVNYAYNYAGSLTGVGTNIRSGAASNDTSNVVTGFAYRGFGAVKAMTYGNGQVFSASYSATRQQLTNQTWQKSGTVIVNKDYNYTLGGNGGNNGRIQKITDNLDGGYTTTYGYDDQHRLASASNAYYTRNYTYDAWGNLTVMGATGIGETGGYTLPYATISTGNQAPATNRVNHTWSNYDGAGNMQLDGNHAYAYDAANRLKSVDSGIYIKPQEYDGDGRRVQNNESVSNIKLFYLWSSVLGQVVADLRSDYVADNVPYRAYVYSPGGAMIAQQSYDTAFTWLHKDHLGSSNKVTDSNGAMVMRDEFDPHGQWVLSWHAGQGGYYNSHKFTGYERDYGSGTHHAKARQYQQNNNRFLQADPLGLGASDLTNPQSLNLYSYVQNDPVNNTDPTGLCVFNININGIQHVSSETYEALKNQLTRIFAAAGQQVVFNSPNLANASYTTTLLNASPADSNSRTLAYTHASGRNIANSGGVYLNAIRAGLAGDSDRALVALGRSPTNLGIAIGRLLAHEVGHYLLQLTNEQHTSFGLMKAQFRGDSNLYRTGSRMFDDLYKFNPAQWARLNNFCKPVPLAEFDPNIGGINPRPLISSNTGGGGTTGFGGGFWDDPFRWLDLIYREPRGIVTSTYKIIPP